MQQPYDPAATSAATSQGALVPVDQLILDVYATAPVQVRSRILSRLIAKVYAAAPPATQRKLLGHLLRPLGLLSLAVVADGIFAKILARSGWMEQNVSLEDVQAIQPGDVVSLVDYVLQVSGDAINGLAQLLMASPNLMGSVAATVLVTLLLQRARQSRLADRELD
jgi:hypothetical protein